MTPTITDDDKGTITAAVDGKVVRSWTYRVNDFVHRQTRMAQAREYAEGWHNCSEFMRPVLRAAMNALTPPRKAFEGEVARTVISVALEGN